MAKVRVKLDRRGMAAMLDSSGVESATREIAESVASTARSHPTVTRHATPVKVYRYIASGGRLASPRPAYSVSLANASGLAQEAKYGVLSRALGEESG